MAIELNDNIKVLAPKPIDSRYFKPNNVPWVSVLEVNATIPSFERHQGLTVNIAGVEYWYKDGIGDLNLMAKSSGTISGTIPVVLGGGKTLGKYTNGQTIPSAGMTFEELIRDIALEYVAPVFTSFTVDSQNTTVEVGTTLSGNRTFNWAVTQNSGVVSTFSIYDNTTSTNIGTGLTGTSANLLTNTRLLSTEGLTQSWKAIGNNTAVGHVGPINSANVVVTARYKRWFGPCQTVPTNRATAIASLTEEYQTGPVNTFTLVTGTDVQKLNLVILLPPGVVVDTVIDRTNFDVPVTSSYVYSGTVNILDAGNVSRAYNKYIFLLGSPYNPSANHEIKTKAQ